MTTKKSLKIYDEQTLNKLHWRMVITAGTGFFTDAYDLFVIGIVTAILSPIWHLTTAQTALLNGAALIAAAFGAILFGSLADKFGRKRMYGFEVVILFFGALLSAFSTSFIWLLVSRIIVGFGIGGDYPSSAVVASEHANRKNRGFLVLLVFAMQALGLIVGPFIASLLLSLHISPDTTWRLLLGLGSIPAASVFYLRRTIAESPWYSQLKKAPKKVIPFEVSRAVSELADYHEQLAEPTFKPQQLLSAKWFKCLLGTAGAWFLLDVAFYGNGVSSVLIMNAMSPNGSLLQHTLLSALIFLCFAVPGYYFAAKYVDTIGRKTLQIFGFFIMMLCYATLALFPAVTQHLILFLIIFGLSFFFVNFGPNTTTFLIPSEIFPTNIRARAHGISAAIGKVGAFIGAFLLPGILHAYGLSFTMGLVAIVALLGIPITLLVPEMKGSSLDTSEISHSHEENGSHFESV